MKHTLWCCAVEKALPWSVTLGTCSTHFCMAGAEVDLVEGDATRVACGAKAHEIELAQREAAAR